MSKLFIHSIFFENCFIIFNTYRKLYAKFAIINLYVSINIL